MATPCSFVHPPLSGLSLCVQGTLNVYFFNFNVPRFIPVCTGNTTPELYLFGVAPVYPCVYREHETRCFDCYKLIGLSLCVQGTRKLLLTNNGDGTVYPCVYREHMYLTLTAVWRSGLSLCVQGTRCSRFLAISQCTVYPCVYREHLAPPFIIFSCSGLSLCVQGTL